MSFGTSEPVGLATETGTFPVEFALKLVERNNFPDGATAMPMPQIAPVLLHGAPAQVWLCVLNVKDMANLLRS